MERARAALRRCCSSSRCRRRSTARAGPGRQGMHPSRPLLRPRALPPRPRAPPLRLPRTARASKPLRRDHNRCSREESNLRRSGSSRAGVGRRRTRATRARRSTRRDRRPSLPLRPPKAAWALAGRRVDSARAGSGRRSRTQRGGERAGAGDARRGTGAHTRLRSIHAIFDAEKAGARTLASCASCATFVASVAAPRINPMGSRCTPSAPAGRPSSCRPRGATCRRASSSAASDARTR